LALIEIPWFETALGKQVKVEVVESLRRGGKTCHFVAHVA
jgi:predicted hydrocarbon binding protein